MTKKGHALLFYQGESNMNGGKTMNIRKNIDYSEMYEALDILMQKSLPQMELYCEIGKAVCRRTEKGASVMASEYRTYENHPALLSRAMKLGWIQNVAIVEAVLAMELREWYIRAAQKFDWTKTELIARIEQEAHLELIIDAEQEKCEEIEICVVIITTAWVSTPCVLIRIIKQVILQRCRGKPYRKHLHDLCVLINIYTCCIIKDIHFGIVLNSR